MSKHMGDDGVQLRPYAITVTAYCPSLSDALDLGATISYMHQRTSVSAFPLASPVPIKMEVDE